MIRRELLFMGSFMGALAYSRSLFAAPAAQAASFPAGLSALSTATEGLLPAATPEQQNAYVLALASLAVRAGLSLDAKLFPMGDFASGVQIGPVGRTPTFALIGYEIWPLAILPPHNHPNYSVVSLGISGEAHIRFYDGNSLPAMTTAASFKVTQTGYVRLRAGETAALTPTRDNIHTFQGGPQGARWVDFTTAHGPDIGFSYLRLGEQPADPNAHDVEARWFKPS
jgi:hypothetical protein